MEYRKLLSYLKSCTCGNSCVSTAKSEIKPWEIQVACPKCHKRGPSCNTSKDAIKSWNFELYGVKTDIPEEN